MSRAYSWRLFHGKLPSSRYQGRSWACEWGLWAVSMATSLGGDLPAAAQTVDQPIDHILTERDISSELFYRGDVIGEFNVEALIAHGGMSSVYSGVHRLIGKRVAIKVLHRQAASDELAIRRFVREARCVNEISHPNLVDIFSFGKLPDGRAYLVMEHLRGQTLHRLIRSGRALPLDLVTGIYEQICAALSVIHRKGFIHRDVKPENIFLLANGQVKLLDFGIAKLRDGRESKSQQTATGTLLGTPEYMAPEQCRGGEIDERTDIYALGVMLYELLTGTRPFGADTALETLQQQLDRQPIPPSEIALGIPPHVERLILQMLAKQAVDRPWSAGAVIEALRRSPVAHRHDGDAAIVLCDSAAKRDTSIGVAPTLALDLGPVCQVSALEEVWQGERTVVEPTRFSSRKAADSISVTIPQLRWPESDAQRWSGAPAEGSSCLPEVDIDTLSIGRRRRGLSPAWLLAWASIAFFLVAASLVLTSA